MNERDERKSNTAAGEHREDRREVRLQSLFTAAYLPLDPSEALARRVAAVLAKELEWSQARTAKEVELFEREARAEGLLGS